MPTLQIASYSTIPWGPTRPGPVYGCGAEAGAPPDVQLDGAKGSFMPLNRHSQGRQEPLGRVEIHHDPLIGLDVLPAGGEWLRIQAEVEDDLFRSRRDPAEIGVRGKRRGIVDDHFGLLLRLGGLDARARFRCFSCLLFRSFHSPRFFGDSRTSGKKHGCPETAGRRRRRSRVSGEAPISANRLPKRKPVVNRRSAESEDSTRRSSSTKVRPAAPFWARTKSRPAAPRAAAASGSSRSSQAARGSALRRRPPALRHCDRATGRPSRESWRCGART